MACETDSSIREKLHSLPKETFVRALRLINAHPSRERLRCVLRWVVCTGAMPLVSLAEAIAAEEMEESWDVTRIKGH
jgi:hypothetical protein